MGEQFDFQKNTHAATALDALAWGLLDGGVQLVTGYPGFHAHDLVDRCHGSYSINEATAFGIAWGASLAGVRAAVAVKNVGLSAAADPFLNSMRLRTEAGLVVVIFDDVEVASSQIRQDSRHYFDLCPGQLWLEPVSPRHAYWCASEAAGLAERFGLPVVLRVTNALLRSRGHVMRKSKTAPRRSFQRNPALAVAHPVNARTQAEAAAKRLLEIAEYVDRFLYPFPISSSFLEVRVGACGPTALSDQQASHCTVWTYPLPEDALRQRLRHASSVEVLEMGSPFVCEKVQALASGLKVRGRDLAADIDNSMQYRISTEFDTLFAALRSFPNRLLIGDLGSYSMDPRHSIDACLAYGSSVAVAIGCTLARYPGPVFSITGDAAAIHSGQACLEEGQRRGAQMVVIVLENGRAGSTGGQVIPGSIRLPPDLPTIAIDHATATTDTYRVALARLSRMPGTTVLRVNC